MDTLIKITTKVLNVIDKGCMKLHRKIKGPKEHITIYFTGDTKKNLEQSSTVFRNHEIIVEIPEKYKDIKSPEASYFDIKCKYKVGDGIHTYSDLHYRYGTIPAACDQTILGEYWD